MSTTAQLKLTATDNTGNAFNSLNKKLTSVGGAMKGFIALFAAEKVVGFFAESLKAATEYDSASKDTGKRIGDTFKTLQVAIGKTLLSNKDLVDGLLGFANKAIPIIVTGINLLVKAFTAIGSVVATVWRNFVKPFIDQIVKGINYLFDQLERLPMIGKSIKAGRQAVSRFVSDAFGESSAMVAESRANVAAGPLSERTTSTKIPTLAKFSMQAKLTETFTRSPLKIDPKTIVDNVDVSKAFQDSMNKFADDAIQAYTDAQNRIVDAIGQTSNVLGSAIGDAFSAAFNGDGIGGVISSFGRTMLAGVGSIFVQLGQTYLSYGTIMKGLAKFLTNPFTAGFAGVAIGAALIAMGTALGAVANRSTQNVAGGVGAQSSQLGSMQNVVSDNKQGSATVVIQGGLLDMSNPEQARALADALGTLTNRRVTIERG